MNEGDDPDAQATWIGYLPWWSVWESVSWKRSARSNKTFLGAPSWMALWRMVFVDASSRKESTKPFSSPSLLLSRTSRRTFHLDSAMSSTRDMGRSISISSESFVDAVLVVLDRLSRVFILYRVGTFVGRIGFETLNDVVRRII